MQKQSYSNTVYAYWTGKSTQAANMLSKQAVLLKQGLCLLDINLFKQGLFSLDIHLFKQCLCSCTGKSTQTRSMLTRQEDQLKQGIFLLDW